MFNGYFYEEEKKKGEEEEGEGGGEVCRRFLDSGVVAVVIDPPFGGLVEVLAKQVHRLWYLAGKGELPNYVPTEVTGTGMSSQSWPPYWCFLTSWSST